MPIPASLGCSPQGVACRDGAARTTGGFRESHVGQALRTAPVALAGQSVLALNLEAHAELRTYRKRATPGRILDDKQQTVW